MPLHIRTGPKCCKAQPSSQDSKPHLRSADPVPDRLPQDLANPIQPGEEPAGSQPLQPLWWENPLAFDSTALTSASLQISRTDILRVSSAVKAATGKHGNSPQSHLLHHEHQPASVMAAHAADNSAQNCGSQEQADARAAFHSDGGHAAEGTLRTDHGADGFLNVQHCLGSNGSEATPVQGHSSTQTGFTFVAGCHHHGSNQQVSWAPASEEPRSAVIDQEIMMDGTSGRRVLADVLNSMHEPPGHGHAMHRLWKAASGASAGPLPGPSHGLEAVSHLPLLPEHLWVNWTRIASLAQTDMDSMHQTPGHGQALQGLWKAAPGTDACPMSACSHEAVSFHPYCLSSNGSKRTASMGCRGTWRGRNPVHSSEDIAILNEKLEWVQ